MIYVEADADVNQEIIAAAVAVAYSVEAVVLLSSGLSYYYLYAAAMMVVAVATVVVVAAVVDSAAEILAYGLSSYYSAAVAMDSARNSWYSNKPSKEKECCDFATLFF